MAEKKRTKSRITAEQLMSELESDPEWVAKRDAREQWRKARAARIGREEAPLVREVSDAGLEINSVWDLVNTREPYPEAIPVLLRHLKRRDYHPAIREGIARALTVKSYPEILPAMIESFREDPDPIVNGPKWAKGNAIEVLFDDRHVEEIVELARDPTHGEARDMLVYALGKSKSPFADEVLQELLADPQLEIHAKKAIELRERRRRKRPR